MEVMRARQSRDQTCCLVQPLCNEPTSSKLTSQHAEKVFGLFIFFFFSLCLLLCYAENHDALLFGMLSWLQD